MEDACTRHSFGSSSTTNMEESSSIILKFDQVELQKVLVEMFIALELSL
jgi:hypothetical protein